MRLGVESSQCVQVRSSPFHVLTKGYLPELCKRRDAVKLQMQNNLQNFEGGRVPKCVFLSEATRLQLEAKYMVLATLPGLVMPTKEVIFAGGDARGDEPFVPVAKPRNPRCVPCVARRICTHS